MSDADYDDVDAAMRRWVCPSCKRDLSFHNRSVFNYAQRQAWFDASEFFHVKASNFPPDSDEDTYGHGLNHGMADAATDLRLMAEGVFTPREALDDETKYDPKAGA